MKETIKISIGGLAFILDKDAYSKLSYYLESLRKYYENKEDGAEIISDIESRISELLQIQTAGKESVINIDDVSYITSIIGNPIDFETDDESNEQYKLDQENKKTRKKLYRDLDNKIIGGVCSGLGQYFKTDPILIRIITLLLVFTGNFFFNKISLYTIVLYLILWVVVPAAKSIKQKIDMLDKSSSLDEFDTKKVKRKELHGAKLGRVLSKTFCILLSIVLIIIGISLIAIPFIWMYSSYVMNIPSIGNIAETFGLGSYNINISLFLIFTIPAILTLFIAVKLLTKFKKRDFKIIGIGVLIWLVSLTFFLKPTVTKLREYKAKAENSREIIIDQQYDTLYVNIGKQYENANPLLPKTQIYINTDKPFTWFILPKINIIKDENFKEAKIKIDKYAWAKSYKEAESLSKEIDSPIIIEDSIINIIPKIFSKQNNYDRLCFNITIYIPLNKEVIINYPIKGWIDADDKNYNNRFRIPYSFD